MEHQFPDDNQISKGQDEGKQKRKLPEFIDLEKERFHKEKAPFEKTIISPPPFHLPFGYRILCLFASIIVAFWTFGGLIIQLIFTLGYLLTFLQSKFMRMMVFDCWGRVCKGTVVTLSLLIAVFSPQFALVVILSYFTLKENRSQTGIVEKMLHKHFGDRMQ